MSSADEGWSLITYFTAACKCLLRQGVHAGADFVIISFISLTVADSGDGAFSFG